ncbi:hypothetical protein CDCA_CDCA02G0596 [Cyanidium caldarium]|uniref:Fructose-bisphosphatase n=1 Tax=Cyanidium caldarium TaxID=2771 RepID=A0AAV9IR72_CYACA|nr:hypothetical protein CDCA_CDCA02G0596 [Cyanidium caldarium]
MQLGEWTGRLGDEQLRGILVALSDAFAEVARALRQDGSPGDDTVSTSSPTSHNVFGDEQLAVDVLADRLVRDRLLRQPGVSLVTSEEDTAETRSAHGGEYAVAYDPLDGSSVLGCNFAVGSIFGIWRATDTLVGKSGNDMVAAGCAVYGPRTQMVFAVRPEGYKMPEEAVGAVEFIHLPSSAVGTAPGASSTPNTVGNIPWRHLRTFDRNALTASTAKVFAPGNLRMTATLPNYDALVRHWMAARLTLRYTGAMVPDVYQLLVRRGGIFCNPSPAADAKLRLVYEVLPLAFLVESVGGTSSDGHGDAAPLLSRRIADVCERTQVALGSPEEVARFERTLGALD